MKSLLILSIVVVCIGLSKQFSSFEDCTEKHAVFADKNVYLGYAYGCKHVKCHADGSFSEKTCPESKCKPGKEIGQKDILKIHTEVYPACCGGPICAP